MNRLRYGACLMGLGAAIALSDAAVLPAAAAYGRWTGADPYAAAGLDGRYAACAVALGLALFAWGLAIRRFESRRLQDFSLTAVSLAVVILLDRILLLACGLPLWMPDAANHYRHRPGAVRSWGNGRLIRINRYGQHGADFPLEKAPGELRVVALGDSVTMGHGLPYEEAYPFQLEKRLKRPAVVINAAVQGYTTSQEAAAFEESLKFKPDVALIGFCMNDVTEPYYVDPRFGGLGVDYHGVLRFSNRALGYLANETGFGRAVQGLRFVGGRRRAALEAKLAETASVTYMASRPLDDPKTALGWRSVTDALDRIRAAAAANRVKAALLIFPYTFQLFNKDAQLPQKALLEYVRRAGLDVVDFTPVFEEALAEPRRRTPGGLPDVGAYFLDDDHLTAQGHRLVAERLRRYLEGRAP